VGEINPWCQFHLHANVQLFIRANALALNFNFTNIPLPNFTTLTLNFYALCCGTSKISINLLAQKLLIECLQKAFAPVDFY